MTVADNRGIEIFFEDTGAGPPVVLGHSFLCSGKMWREQVPVLAARYRVINADLRGHGRSGRVADPFSLYDAVSDVITVLDELGTLECELLDRRRFRTQVEARLAIFDFIEGWYNPRRRHSALDYRSPMMYERSHAAGDRTLPSGSTIDTGVLSRYPPRCWRRDVFESSEPSTEPGQLQDRSSGGAWVAQIAKSRRNRGAPTGVLRRHADAVYGDCMARLISTTVRLEEEDVRALQRARAAGHSASALIRRGLRVVASRYYTGRRPPTTRLFESTDNKLGDESELFRKLEV